jgi:hypothetical protein
MDKSRYTKKIRCWFISAREYYWPWVIAAMTALSANWAANAIQDSVEVWWSGGSIRISLGRTVAVISFICFCILFVRNKKRFFAPRTRYLTDNEAPEQRKCLFLFLSINERNPFKGGLPEGLELGFTHLGTDLQKIWDAKTADSSKRCNCEMPLRAIWHHISTLNICLRYERLKKQFAFLVLGCKDGRPFLYDPQSITRTEKFKPGTFKHEGLEGLSFDSFDMLTKALRHAFCKLKVPEEDIMIDITGGKKPNSVVGAAVTFNTRIKAQYVDTEGKNQVRSYDVLYVTADTGGLEM